MHSFCNENKVKGFRVRKMFEFKLAVFEELKKQYLKQKKAYFIMK